MKQGVVKYKSQMKQTHIQHKANICRVWGIEHNNHNNNSDLNGEENLIVLN